MKKVELFTDGACSGNPGPGGWGVLLRYGDHEKELSGAVQDTTNNRMELTAAIMGLKALKEGCSVDLTTDSEYVKRGITEWIDGWIQKGWKNSQKKPVKNADLWQTLKDEVDKHNVTWHWVKGHSGHPENERADMLATGAVQRLKIEGE